MRKFLLEIQLKEHQKRHLKARSPFQCLVCNKRFDNKFTLKKHETETHSFDAVIYKCNHCSYESKSNGVLKTHISRKHTDVSELTIECDYEGCHQMFKNQQYNAKTFKFSSFGKTVCLRLARVRLLSHIHSVKMSAHKLTHTAQRDLKCGFEGCAKCFKSNQTLENTQRPSSEEVCLFVA